MGLSVLMYAVGMQVALGSVSVVETACVTTSWTPIGAAVAIVATICAAWTAARRGSGLVLLALTMLVVFMVLGALAIASITYVLCGIGPLNGD